MPLDPLFGRSGVRGIRSAQCVLLLNSILLRELRPFVGWEVLVRRLGRQGVGRWISWWRHCNSICGLLERYVLSSQVAEAVSLPCSMLLAVRFLAVIDDTDDFPSNFHHEIPDQMPNQGRMHSYGYNYAT